MSLEVTITPVDPTILISHFNVNDPLLLAGRLRLSPRQKGFLRRRTIGFQIDGIHDGLSESADWDSPFWILEQWASQDLSQLLDQVVQLGVVKFTLSACWSGEKANSEEIIRIDDFRTLLKSGRIGNKIRYNVTASDHPDHA